LVFGVGYDLSATSYSPTGSIAQIEYAQKAVANAQTVVGICCKDGVVIGIEIRSSSKMEVNRQNRNVLIVDRHAGMVTGGMGPDGRVLASKAMEEGALYKSFYGSKIPGRILAERLATYVHIFTLYWSLRPFGSTALVATYDTDGPALYQIAPSGACTRLYGSAIGMNQQGAQHEIEKLVLTELRAKEAVKALEKIIRQLHTETENCEVEIGWISDDTNREFKHIRN